MTGRARLLMILVFAALGLFVGDKMLFGFFLDPWKQVTDDIRKVDKKLAKADAVLSRRDAAREQWQQVRALLAKPRTPDVQNHFYTHLDALCDRVGVNPDMQAGAPQKQGEFQEYVYEMRFKLTWTQFVDLVRELHNSGEFLKPIRINIASRYQKEERLDLDLRVSTIEARNGNGHGADPAPPAPSRPQIAAADLKALRETNIFSPYRARGEIPKPATSTATSRTTRSTSTYSRGPKPPLVTGIVLDPEGGDHRVVVEDRNSSSFRKFDKPKFLKAGDELMGYTIESVARDRVVLRRDEETKELAVGDSFPADGGAASGEGDAPSPSTGIKKLDDSTRNAVLEQLRQKLNKKRRYDDEP